MATFGFSREAAGAGQCTGMALRGQPQKRLIGSLT